jgi:predicted amidohydrolase YtcJ
VGWANTAALDATVGLNRLRRMDAPPGGHIYRDDAGRPTGVLRDRAMALVTDRLPAPTPAAEDRALHTALRHTARHGLTGLHDAGVNRTELQRLHRFVEAGDCPLRVSTMGLGAHDDVDAFCQQGPWRHPSGRLDATSIKLFADGALGSRGAALLDDYADTPGTRGSLRHSPEALRRHVRAAAEHGFQVCAHAIGDRAARAVLDAYTAVARRDDVSLRRPRLEHAQVLQPEDVARLADLGGVASVQPDHAVHDRAWAGTRLGPDRLANAYAWPRLHRAGVPLAFGSDAPVAPLGPLRAIHAAVTEQTSPDGSVLSPALPRRVALHAHTRGAAYAAGRADTVGALTPGRRADWVVLSHDIMRVPPAALPDVEVIATYLDGHCVHAQSDWPDP